MPNVVLVEDDCVFAEELIDFLESHGIQTTWFATMDQRITEIVELNPDIVVLDQFVAGHDCLTSLVDLRRSYRGGVLVLTGNMDVVDRIVALETGADDYVAKSLGPRELLARLRAVLRRVAPADSSANPVPPNAPAAGATVAAVTRQPWTIDLRRHLVVAPDGVPLALTNLEFEAVDYLSRNAGRLITRDELSLALLARPYTPLDRSVDNMLSRIRKALEPHMQDEPAIRSIRGRGYIFAGFDLA